MSADIARRSFSGRRPSGSPPQPGPRPPVELSPEAKRQDLAANDLFEKTAALNAAPTETRPALVHITDIQQLRQRISTGAGRLDALTKCVGWRLDFYLREKSGTEPFDPLTPEQERDARAYFEKYGARLKGEAGVAPENPIKERERQAQAQLTQPEKQHPPAAGATAEPALTVPSPAATAPRPEPRSDLPLPPPATLEMRYLSPEGFECRLVLSAPTGVQVLDQGAAARKKLIEQQAKPVPAVETVVNVTLPAAAPASAGKSERSDGEAAPKCKIHKSPMKHGKKGWFCPRKDEDTATGYCDFTLDG